MDANRRQAINRLEHRQELQPDPKGVPHFPAILLRCRHANHPNRPQIPVAVVNKNPKRTNHRRHIIIQHNRPLRPLIKTALHIPAMLGRGLLPAAPPAEGRNRQASQTQNGQDCLGHWGWGE